MAQPSPEQRRKPAEALMAENKPEDDLVELLWRDFDHNTPAAFWDVATWTDGNWSPGSLDVADRKRIGKALIKYARERREP
jgi:hypothetical protein